jgi:hypothetical protein
LALPGSPTSIRSAAPIKPTALGDDANLIELTVVLIEQLAKLRLVVGDEAVQDPSRVAVRGTLASLVALVGHLDRDSFLALYPYYA